MITAFSSVATSPQLRIDTTYPALGTVRVGVVGEVDLVTAGILRDGLLTVLRERAPVVLTVDLSGVDFLDCTGISALLAVHHAAVRGGCQVRIAGLQPIVLRILDVTGMLDVLIVPADQVPQPVANPGGPASAGPVRDPLPQHPEWLIAA